MTYAEFWLLAVGVAALLLWPRSLYPKGSLRFLPMGWWGLLVLLLTPLGVYLTARGWLEISPTALETNPSLAIFTMTLGLLAGLALLGVLWGVRFTQPPLPANPKLRWWGLALAAAVSLAGAAMLNLAQPWSILGTLLAYFGPLLLVLWCMGADLLWPRRRTVALSGLAGFLAFALVGSPWQVALFAGLVLWVAVQTTLLCLHPTFAVRLHLLTRAVRPWQLWVALYVLLKIPVPLAPELFPLVGTLSTACLVLAGIAWAWEKVGPQALVLALVAGFIGWAVEVLGYRTDLLFGQYDYTAPGILLGGVPLLVVMGWFAMPLAALGLSGGRPWLAGLMLVAWDIGLEPLMVAKGYWVWQDPAALWYGAPLQNFVAWWLVGTFIAWVLQRLSPKLAHDASLGIAYRLEALFLPAGLAMMLGAWDAAVLCALAMNGLAWWPKHWSKRLFAAR